MTGNKLELPASLGPELIRSFVPWMIQFVGNLPDGGSSFEPTDAETREIWEAFVSGDRSMGNAWTTAARIWEARGN